MVSGVPLNSGVRCRATTASFTMRAASSNIHRYPRMLVSHKIARPARMSREIAISATDETQKLPRRFLLACAVAHIATDKLHAGFECCPANRRARVVSKNCRGAAP